MPPISDYRCDACDYPLPHWYGGVFYAVNEGGERVACPHPSKEDLARQVPQLGYAEWFNSQFDALCKAHKIGFLHDALCVNCLHQFQADCRKGDPPLAAAAAQPRVSGAYWKCSISGARSVALAWSGKYQRGGGRERR